MLKLINWKGNLRTMEQRFQVVYINEFSNPVDASYRHHVGIIDEYGEVTVVEADDYGRFEANNRIKYIEEVRASTRYYKNVYKNDKHSNTQKNIDYVTNSAHYYCNDYLFTMSYERYNDDGTLVEGSEKILNVLKDGD